MRWLQTFALFLGFATALPACTAARSDGDGDSVATAEEALSGTATLVSGSPTAGGYDFSAGVFTGLSGGDFYFVQGAFWANNAGQRGVVSVGACPSVSSVTTMPTSGYTQFGVNAVVGRCYVALTHNDERDHIVFRVTAKTSTTVTFAWKLIPSSDRGATLVDGSPTAGGYDFSTRTYTGLTPGDFYFVQGGFWSNNLGQRGVVSIGACSSVDAVAQTPQTGYSRFGVPAVVGSCYAALTHNEEHDTILFRVDALTSSTVTLTWKLVDDCFGYPDPRKSVNCWLSQTTGVSSSLNWENRVSLGVTSVLAWPAWSNAQRDELRADVLSYETMLGNQAAVDPDPLVDPPVNQETLQDSSFPVGVLSLNDGWRLYVKTVAMSLAVEVTQYVPWSVTSSSYDSRSLASLFDSRHLLSYTWSGRPGDLGVPTPSSEGYILVSNNYDAATHATFSPYVAYATPAPPDKALNFLRGKSLVGATRLQTITSTLDWARRLRHFTGGQTTGDFQTNWQYRGPAPVTTTINTSTNVTNNPSVAHYTAGCHGTSGLLNSLLRVVNIPVDNDVVAGHSATRFMTEALSLSHGDDLYIGSDPYGAPASAWLISDATFSDWFVNTTPTLIGEDVGRRNPDLLIQYLSPLLQFLYCIDPVPGADHAHSRVFTTSDFFIRPDVYPLTYLENLPPDPGNPSLPPSLWDRLAQKVAAQGGCTTTMAAINQQMTACEAVMPQAEQLDCTW